MSNSGEPLNHSKELSSVPGTLSSLHLCDSRLQFCAFGVGSEWLVLQSHTLDRQLMVPLQVRNSVDWWKVDWWKDQLNICAGVPFYRPAPSWLGGEHTSVPSQLRTDGQLKKPVSTSICQSSGLSGTVAFISYPSLGQISLGSWWTMYPACFFINRQGGARSSSLTLKLWNWDLCIAHQMQISAVYLTGIQNTTPDIFSRCFSQDYDGS